MKNFAFAIVLAMVGLFATPVMADAISYNNVSGFYQHTEVDDGLASDQGFGVSFSKTLGDTFFVRGSAERSGYKGLDQDVYRLGIGHRWGLNESLDIYAVGYGLKAIIDYDNPALNNWDSYGYGGEVGARFALNNRLEVRGGVASERVTASSSWETYGLVGATLSLTDRFALVGDARLNDDIQQFNVGVQLQF